MGLLRNLLSACKSAKQGSTYSLGFSVAPGKESKKDAETATTESESPLVKPQAPSPGKKKVPK